MSKPIQWEYRVEYRRGSDDILRELKDDMGPKGWELCGVVTTTEAPSDLTSNYPSVVRYYFKRPRLGP